MDMVNKAFIETMIEGDANGRGFHTRSRPTPSHPILTGPIRRIIRLLFKMTAKYGTPYFSNYINSDMNQATCAPCAAVSAWICVSFEKTGGFFGSGEHRSVGVVTINMPRIAYQSKDEKEFYRRLDHMMDIAARSLKRRNVRSLPAP